jgi:hypothetical protein
MAKNRSEYHARHLREKREAERKQKEIIDSFITRRKNPR